MIKNSYRAIIVGISVLLLISLSGCAGSMGRYIWPEDDGFSVNPVYYPKWNFNVISEKAAAPALVTLSIFRHNAYNQPDVKIKYKIDDQPWVVASFLDNTVNRSNQCEILFFFTNPGVFKLLQRYTIWMIHLLDIAMLQISPF